MTPFDGNDNIRPDLLAPIIDGAIVAGVHVLVSNGNTGEFSGLTMDEALEMVRKTAELVDRRAPLIGGVGRSVREACQLARTSKESGCDAIMVHQAPDPFVAPRGLKDYVSRIADAADGLPLVLYVRNDAMGTNAIAELCAIPSVIGVKWATPNPQKLAEAMRACDPSIMWVGGLAETWAPALYAVGARGFTSGLINVWPQRSVEIHHALEQQDYSKARELIEGMRAFEEVRAEEMGGANVSGVKAALKLLGNDCGHARPPAAWPLTRNQSEKIASLLSSAGLHPA